jgi:hypothetical protein
MNAAKTILVIGCGLLLLSLPLACISWGAP